MRWNIRAPHLLSASFLALVLTACGGGGSDSSSSSDNNSGSGNSGGGQPSGVTDNNTPPTVNAGEDQTVDEGSQVRLTASFSDSDGDSLTDAEWKQVSGPEVEPPGLNISGSTISSGGGVTFGSRIIAPVVEGSGNSVTLVFELTMTDERGAKATDSVTITVNAVNAEPVVNLSDQRVIEAETVTLASNATDPDGDIVSYAWEQTSGSEVTLSSIDEATVSFTAPMTDTVETLEFSLTVTDNEDASVTETVSVDVASVNTPDIVMSFPPAIGSYTSADIDAFGVSETKGGATITSVTVTTDAGTVEATVNDDGSWRANNIAIPSDVDAFTLIAEITDSEGRVRQAVSNLNATEEVGSGIKIENDVKSVLLDGDTAYVITSHTTITTDHRFIAVDLATGERTSITDNTNEDQGLIINAPRGAALDKANGRILVNDGGLRAIVAISLSDGQRSIVSDDGNGSDFDLPLDLSLNVDANLAYLVDNPVNSIFSVDLMTGDRTVIADSTTSDIPVEAPLSLIFDNTNNRIIYHTNAAGGGPIYSLDLSVSPATSSIISTNEANDGPALRQGAFALALNNNGTVAYAISGEGNIQSINLATGTRELVSGTAFDTFGGAQTVDLIYDNVNNLIYTAGKDEPFRDNALFAVDPQTGDRVKLSQ